MSSILGQAFVRIRPDTTGFKSETESGISRALGGIAGLAKKAMLPIGATLAAAGGLGIKTAADMEQANIAFTTMLGSGQRAQAFLTKLQKFAAATPFEFPELQTAASSLISIGIDADKVIPIMTSLGNATAGMGTGAEGVQRATTAIQQMTAAGRISMEDLNQLRDAGIPVYDLLAAATGKSKEEVAGLAQAGKLGRKELEQLMSALETGKGLERFNGLMEKQSASLAGMFSTLKDTVQLDLAQMVQPLIPAIKSTMDRATPLIGSFLDKVNRETAVLVKQLPLIVKGAVQGDSVGIAESLDAIFGNTGNKTEMFKGLVDQVMFTFGQVKDIVLSLAKIAQDVGPVIGTALGGSVRLAWEAFKLLLPAVAAVLDFLANHEPVLWTLVGAWLALTAAVKAHQLALAISKAGNFTMWLDGLIKKTQLAVTVTKAWAAVQWVLNAAMSANPFVLAGIALAALVTGFVLAWKNSQTFRDIVTTALHAVADAATWVWTKVLQPVFSGITTAWSATASGFEWAYANIIQPVWGGLGRAVSSVWTGVLQPTFAAIGTGWSALTAGIQWAWANVLSPVWSVIQAAAKILFAILVVATFGPILVAWKALTAGIQWEWANVLQPTWNAVSADAQWLYGKVLSPIFGFISQAWSASVSSIQWAYANILQPAWNAVQAAAQWLYSNVLAPVFGFISRDWNASVTAIQWAYNNILQPAWNALQTAASWMWTNVLSPTFAAIGDAWGKVLTGMRWVYDNVVHPMWGIISAGIGGAKTAFDTAVSGIKDAWNKIKAITAEPINFVIGTVLNNGLFKAFNSVIDVLHLPAQWRLGPLDLIKLATGGTVPGFSPNDRADNIPAMLTAGEWVHPVASAKYYGDDVMEGIRTRRIPRDALKSALHLADGGPVYQQLFGLVRRQFPNANLNDGFRPGANDFHGQGLAVDLGKVGQAGGDGTPFLASVNRWIYDNFAKGTLELIYDGAGDDRPDVKNGKSYDYGPALRAQHHNHVHWAARSLAALGAGGGDAAGAGGGDGGGFFDVLGKLKDAVTSPMKNFIGKFGDSTLTKIIAEVPGKMVDNVWSKVKDVALSLVSGAANSVVDFFSSGGGQAASGVAGAVNRWAPIVDRVLGEIGIPLTARNGVLNIIKQESGGDPNAINLWDSNAKAGHPSQGLMQLIPGTFAANAGPYAGLGIRNPLANIFAGVMYAFRKYGVGMLMQGGRKDSNGGYLGYALGGKVKGPTLYDNGGQLKHGQAGINLSGKPEAVLTNEQWGKLDKIATTGVGGLHIGEIHVHPNAPGETTADQLQEVAWQMRRLARGSMIPRYRRPAGNTIR